MTMLITKFNKLIANKFVWIGFTFLIILAFVAWDMSVPDDARDPSSQAAGTLYGKPVSPDELRNAYVHTYMGLLLNVGQPIPIDPELDAELTNMAWKRIVSLRKGDELGIKTSNSEVVSAIRNFPGFTHQGQFSPEIYRQFVQQYLGALGFTGSQFEEHIRQELVLQKLQRMVSESILVSPAEINRSISVFGDEFTVQYVKIDEEVLGAGMDITDEEAQAFFAENAELFTIPPKVSVRYVRFAIDDFLADTEVTEAQALDYYDLNIEEFVTAESADQPDADADDLSDDDLFQITTTLPFEDVKEEIIARLTREAAARRAADVAMDFVIKLVPDRQGLAASFDEAASEFGVTVDTTAPFAQGEVPEGIDAGVPFSLAAFELRPNPEYYFSDAIEGAEHIYVLALNERIPQRVPEFDEVADRVREAAQRQAVTDGVRDLATTFQESVVANLREGKSFSDSAEQFAIPASELITFTVAGGLTNDVYGQEIVRAVVAHNKGEVTEPAAVAGGYIVVHVANRVEADPTQYSDFRPQIVGSLARERGRILFDQWQEQLLKDADFTPRINDRRPIDDDVDDDFYEDDWASS